MKRDIYLNKTPIELLEPQKEPDDGKHWSYSYVYYIEDLRNIYRLYDEFSIDSLSSLYFKCEEIGLKSWSGKRWNKRNLLELANALKNFKLLSVDGNRVCNKGLFSSTKPESPLTEEEMEFFRGVYSSYFRFKEFHNLFSSTNIVLYYMDGVRFTNRFIISMQEPVKIVGIADEHSDMMRFWDVYLKWGVSLGMLKKYPLKPFGVVTIPSVKGLNMVYFYELMPPDFSVFNYISTELQGSYFYIPDVVYSIISKRRYTVESVLEKIVEESINKPEIYRSQSTSAIFVNEKENFLFPKIGNAYITHLLKL